MILVASSWFIDDWKSIWWIDWDNIYHSVLLIRKILQQIFHGWISCPVYYAHLTSHSTYQCSSFCSESCKSFSLEPCKRNSLSFPSHYIASTPSQYYHSHQKPASEQDPADPIQPECHITDDSRIRLWNWSNPNSRQNDTIEQVHPKPEFPNMYSLKLLTPFLKPPLSTVKKNADTRSRGKYQGDPSIATLHVLISGFKGG